jgi:hypothetical protein
MQHSLKADEALMAETAIVSIYSCDCFAAHRLE